MVGAAAALAAALTMASLASAQPKVDAAALYKTNCQLCHGADGSSKMKNASFTDGTWLHGSSLAEVQKVIGGGVKGTVMQSFAAKLKPAEIEALARHVRAFDPKLK
jgi:mono/diheme cytochrome c family protein